MSSKVHWENHKAMACEAITQAFINGQFTDLTIAAGDLFIRCHRLVLSHYSAFFKSVLMCKETSQSDIVVVLTAPSNVVRAMITFMYHGEVGIESSSLPALRQLAESLGVAALMNISDPPVEQLPVPSQSSRIIDAAEALQAMRHGVDRNRSSFPNRMPFANHNHVPLHSQTARHNQVSQSYSTGYPRQPESQIPEEQPMAGISPAVKIEDDMVRDTKYSLFHASGCGSNSEPASAISPPLPTRSPNVPPPLKKRKYSNLEPFTDDIVSPSTSGLPHTSSSEEDTDSRDSDGELQIVESPESQSTEGDDSEPHDLRVEPRLSSSVDTRPISSLANNNFRAGNVVPSSVPSTARRLYPSSGLHDVTIQPAHSHNVAPLSNNAASSFRIIQNNTGVLSQALSSSHQRRPKAKTHNKRSSPKLSKKIKNETPKAKTYTPDQLADSVMAVISGGLQPVEAITRYGIPRRTFFRRLLLKRKELGILGKSRSKTSSRANSPNQEANAPRQGRSPNMSVDALSNGMYRDVPTSGTQLHEMLMNMSSANSSTSTTATIITHNVKVEDGMSSDANSSDFIAERLEVEVTEEVGDVVTQ